MHLLSSLCVLLTAIAQLASCDRASDCATCNPGKITFWSENAFRGVPSQPVDIVWEQCSAIPIGNGVGLSDTGSSWRVRNVLHLESLVDLTEYKGRS